jgi:hypothetical protein
MPNPTPGPTRPTLAVLLLGLTLSACNADSPVLADTHLAHENGLVLSSLSKTTEAQALSELHKFSASFHSMKQAEKAEYKLFALEPLTAADGCISDKVEGGMGYHYSRMDNLGDDMVSLLDPEFLVYAPENGPQKSGEVKTKLAGFDYFLPYSDKWPGPENPNFKRPPELHDFPTMKALPNIKFAPSRFGGWMVHIWLWEPNPDGMYANWNRAVPLCRGSEY